MGLFVRKRPTRRRLGSAICVELISGCSSNSSSSSLKERLWREAMGRGGGDGERQEKVQDWLWLKTSHKERMRENLLLTRRENNISKTLISSLLLKKNFLCVCDQILFL